MPQTDLTGSGRGPGSPQATLVPFSFWTSSAATSGERLAAAMAGHFAELGLSAAEPLRWAITAVDPQRGLQLEGIALAADRGPDGFTDTFLASPRPESRSR